MNHVCETIKCPHCKKDIMNYFKCPIAFENETICWHEWYFRIAITEMKYNYDRRNLKNCPNIEKLKVIIELEIL